MLNFKLIDNKALSLLKRSGELGTPPVNLNNVLSFLDLNLVPNDPDDDGLSGALLREEESATVFVNETHSELRQRFTIAHEIGHYVLHKGEKSFVDGTRTQLLLRSNTGVKNQMETEANAFGAALLMPEPLLRKEYEKYILENPNASQDKIIMTLSDVFNVSFQSMGYRLTNLGYGI